MQEVLCLTYTGNFYFWGLMPGREIYFLGLALLESRCILIYITFKLYPQWEFSLTILSNKR